MNKILEKLKDLFLFVNFMDSLKFGVVMYLISYIGKKYVGILLVNFVLGSICNLLTIVILGWISVFSIPRLYMDNRSLIDCMWEKLQCQMVDLKNKVCGAGSNSVKIPEDMSAEKDESSDAAVSSPSSVKDEVADSPAVSQEKTPEKEE